MVARNDDTLKGLFLGGRMMVHSKDSFGWKDLWYIARTLWFEGMMIQSKDSLGLMEPSYIVRTLLVGRNDVHTCDSFNLKCPTLWSEWLTCIFFFIHFAFMQGFLHFVPNSNPFYSNSINFSPNSKCYLNLGKILANLNFFTKISCQTSHFEPKIDLLCICLFKLSS